MEFINETLNYMADCEILKFADVLKSAVSLTHAKISLPYTIYRWVQFVLHFLILLGATVQLQKATKTHSPMFYATLLLYLAIWVLIANVVHSLMGAMAVTKAYMHYASGGIIKTEGNNRIYTIPRGYLRAYTVMHNIAVNFSVFMAFGYWELMGTLPKGTTQESRMEFTWYGLSALLMFLDHLVVRFTYKMATGLYSLGIMVIYLSVTWVHFRIGSADHHHHNKHYIYPGLDWSKPKAAASHAFWSVFLLEVINCCTLWWFCQLKKYVRDKIHGKYHSTPNEPSRDNSPMPEQPPQTQQVNLRPPSPAPPPTEPYMKKQSTHEPEVEQSKKKKA